MQQLLLNRGFGRLRNFLLFIVFMPSQLILFGNHAIGSVYANDIFRLLKITITMLADLAEILELLGKLWLCMV